jgi:NADPH-dependent glutamate synthase beta subunit-like oxidoreductase
MLTLGIPSFRLEKDVVNAEIDILREMGVEFKCGVEVGKDVTIQQLRDEGYKGFYIAIGAQKSAPIKVPGEDLKGVFGGVDFLRQVNLGKRPHVGKKCAVIGGGNVAMDVCRSALRLGAKGHLYNLPPLPGRDCPPPLTRWPRPKKRACSSASCARPPRSSARTAG